MQPFYTVDLESLAKRFHGNALILKSQWQVKAFTLANTIKIKGCGAVYNVIIPVVIPS